MLNTMERLFTLTERIVEVPHGRAMRVFLLVLCVDSLDKLRADSKGKGDRPLKDTLADFVNNWLAPGDLRILSGKVGIEDDCGICAPSSASLLVEVRYTPRNAYVHESDGTLFPFSNDGVACFSQGMVIEGKSPKEIRLCGQKPGLEMRQGDVRVLT